MTTPIRGFPGERAQFAADANAATILVDDDLYEVEAIYAAAYAFIDRCFVLLDRPESGRLRITLTGRAAAGEAETMRELTGEFANELLSCAWRQKIVAANRATIEATTTRALAGAMGPPSLDDLAAFDFTDEAFDDPLGIAVSWEEKYGSGKEPPGDSDEADEEGSA